MGLVVLEMLDFSLEKETTIRCAFLEPGYCPKKKKRKYIEQLQAVHIAAPGCSNYRVIQATVAQRGEAVGLTQYLKIYTIQVFKVPVSQKGFLELAFVIIFLLFTIFVVSVLIQAVSVIFLICHIYYVLKVYYIYRSYVSIFIPITNIFISIFMSIYIYVYIYVYVCVVVAA